MPTATTTAPTRLDRKDDFYRHMATMCLAIAVVAFVPSFWLPMAQGTLDLSVAIQAHGFLFFGWLVLFRIQAGLIGSGRTALHRSVGVGGAVLAVLMFVAVIRVQAVLQPRYDAQGLHAEARAFAWLNVSDMLVFGALVAGVILNVRRPEVHKRLLLAATVSLMAIPLGRLLLMGARVAGVIPHGGGGPPPLTAAFVPHALAALLLAAAAWRDRKRIGRIHGAYGAGLFAMGVQMLTLIAIGRSGAWAALVDAALS